MTYWPLSRTVWMFLSISDFNVMVLPDVAVEFNFHGAGNYSTAAQKQEFFIR